MWDFVKKTVGAFVTFAIVITLLGFGFGIVTGIILNTSDNDTPVVDDATQVSSIVAYNTGGEMAGI